MKSKKKRNFFQSNYAESWNYVKESKNFIYWTVGIFFFFTLIGFFLPVPTSIQDALIELIRELLRQTEDLSQLDLITFIFLNNVQSSFTGLLFGIGLGIFPVIGAILNGYLLGFVAAETVGAEGIFILFKLLPHGIFELPALFISLGLGLKLGTFIFKKNRIKTLRSYLVKSMKVFVFIVVPLLVIAAIIEGTLIALAG